MRVLDSTQQQLTSIFETIVNALSEEDRPQHRNHYPALFDKYVASFKSPDKVINMALPHWVHPVFITLSIVLAMSCVVSTTFNGLTMIVIRKSHSLHKPSFILLFELALIDFITGLIVQPFYIWKLVVLTQTSKDSLNVCVKRVDEFSGHVRMASVAITALLLTAVSFDRFLALHLKTNYQVTVSIKRAIAVSVLLWIGGIGVVAIAVGSKIKQFMVMVLGFCVFVTLAIFIANRRALVKNLQRVSNNNRNDQVFHPEIQETAGRVNT